MRKFLIRTGLVLMAVTALFVWFRSDASVLASANVLGMDDSAGWAAANNENPEVMDTLEAANVRMLQVDLPWNKVELSPGAFGWAIQTDDGYIDYSLLFERMRIHNIEPLVVLSGGPVYLGNLYPQQPIFRDQLLESWEQYLHAVIEQFGDDVDYWQIGGMVNDPAQWGSVQFPGADAPLSAPDPELYGEMVAIAHDVIKSSQATDSIVLGTLGFSGDCIFHPINYLQTLHDLNLWKSFDVISLTLPRLDAQPEKATFDDCGALPSQESGIPGADSILTVVEFAEAAGEKPVWVHGLRFSKKMLSAAADERGTISEVAASDHLARASGLYLSYGKADRIFWDFNPLANAPGLIAMQTYANLSRTLSNRFEGDSLATGTEAFALRFRGNGKLSVLAWYAQGGEMVNPMVISGMDGYNLHAFAADSDSLKTRDGVEIPVDAGGSAALLVSEHPVVISGQPASIKQTITQSVEDSASQANAGLTAKVNNWLDALKTKTIAKVDGWIEERSASLLDTMKDSFKSWIRESLGIKKL